MSSLLSCFLPMPHRQLIWQFVRREVLGRYRGSVLGVGWSFITPLLMLGVYTFVFVGVFKARWPGAEQAGGLEFSIQIFTGLMIFNLFAEVANRAPRLILEQPNLVKKVVFPLEVLPWVSVISGLFHLLLSAFVLVLVVGAMREGGLSMTAIALPLVLIPFIVFLLGLCWLLSALGVFVRDVGQVMGFVVNLALFLSPVFYSLKSLAPGMRNVMQFNPLTQVIENTRAVLLQGVWPQWDLWALYLVAASLFAAFSAYFFQVTRKGFADVL